jgi:hypothetical protein
MILLSPLFAPANIIARFPQHFAPRTFLPNGNPEHAALAPTAYRRGRVRGQPWRKQPMPRAGSANVGSTILIAGRMLLRLGGGEFNHNLIWSRRT